PPGQPTRSPRAPIVAPAHRLQSVCEYQWWCVRARAAHPECRHTSCGAGTSIAVGAWIRRGRVVVDAAVGEGAHRLVRQDRDVTRVPAPDGAHLAVQTSGAGAPLLLLSGQAGSHEWWTRVRS